MRRSVALVGLTLALSGSAASAAEPQSGTIVTAQAAPAPAEATAAALAAWDGASYDSLADFLGGLQAGRYTVLVFRRMSADLRDGRVDVLDPVFERYFAGRQTLHGLSDPLIRDGRFLTGVEEDVRAGLAHANASTDLTVPDFTVAAIIGRARHIVRTTYGLPGGNDAPLRNRVAPPEAVTAETPGEDAQRAENTGLLHDVVDFVSQPHLQFLVGGVGVTQKARLVAEALKIARRDKHTVDETSVEAFVDRLIEAGLVTSGDRAICIEQTLVAVGLRETAPAEEDATSGVPDAPETGAPPDLDPSPPAAVVDEPAAAPAPAAPADTGDEAVADDAPPAAVVPRDAGPRPPVARPQTQVPETPAAPGPGDRTNLLVTLEAGMGATLPAGDGDLSGLAGAVARDPGVAGRLGIGVTWLNAIGPAHLSLGLVGVVGETKSERLVDRGGLGPLDTGGTGSYVGILPFLSVELPLFDGVNARFGGGLGIAHQDISVVDGGVELVDADGASLIAQFGGGLRAAVTPCMDFGIDVFATYLDDVGGRTNLGAPVRYGGTWDVAAYLGVRVALSGDAPGLFSAHGGRSAPCF
ncbi:MAG: hypothetical protein ACR2PM_12125 [Hyphomicrobiales bacterium]